jgi:hypothetical protein
MVNTDYPYQDLKRLAKQAWDLHSEAKLFSPCLVQPSMPILYFGDAIAYHGSQFKVITVGLNPSYSEFPAQSPFLRFPDAKHFDLEESIDIEIYLTSLNNYFNKSPYRSWFDSSFEEILRGIGASYYSGRSLTALHTDICTPLATKPTWSGLTKTERAPMEFNGKKLWHNLMETIRPDIAIVSVAHDYLDSIGFPEEEKSRIIFTIDGSNRKRAYNVHAAWRRLKSGKRVLFIFGMAAQKPFGTVSARDKYAIGEKIMEIYNG